MSFRQPTKDDLVRNTARINFVILAHGEQPVVGFTWRDTFIHDPFADPQYGAFTVDPVRRYGDAYLYSVFSTDPSGALRCAQEQLRAAAARDVVRYCSQDLPLSGDPAGISPLACAVSLTADDALAALSDEQVMTVWASVDENPTFRRQGRE